MLKTRVKQFVKWNITNPIKEAIDTSTRRDVNELLYQGIFEKQCQRLGIDNIFYPLGAAANHTLMYALARLFEEYELTDILELGSGQTTLLIDKIKPRAARHTCFEHIPSWHKYLSVRLGDVDYQLHELTPQTVSGHACLWYDNVELVDFDLLVVDGPHGSERFSRIGCLRLIERNRRDDFVIIIDDTHRRGERETADLIIDILKRDRIIHVTEFSAFKGQTLIATDAFRQAAFF